MNPGRIPVSSAIVAACGLLFAFIGNMLPKFKSNFFAGIRTPWTLSSDEVWQKTHRLAGFMWFFAGILIIALSFFMRGTEFALYTAMMIITAVIAVIPLVMSFIWYQKLPKSNED
jgi:uncharacterized membrane protein